MKKDDLTKRNDYNNDNVLAKRKIKRETKRRGLLFMN